MINKQKAIDNIIENFNWEKVHTAMVALDWRWQDDYEPPTTGALFRHAVDLLHYAYDEAIENRCDYSVRTGGFYARALVNEETKEVESLRLAFEVCSWEYYD